MRALLGILLAAFCIASAYPVSSETVIDGATQETFERSISQMRDQLSPEQIEPFERGLMNLILSEYPPAKGQSGLALLGFAPHAIEAAHRTLDGFTLDQILERGVEVASQARAPSPETSVTENTINSKRICLQRAVKVSNARFVRSDFGLEYIEFSVRNGLEWPIAGIWISYVIREQGRTVPWDDDDYPIGIDGGIEPGETRQLSGRAEVSLEAGSELNVDVEVLDVADAGNRLLVAERGVFDWPDEASPEECK